MQDMETLFKRMTSALDVLEKNSAEGISNTDLKLLLERNRLLEETLDQTISLMAGYIQSINEILESNKPNEAEPVPKPIPTTMAVDELVDE